MFNLAIPTFEGTMDAYAVGEPGAPGLVVVQEIFGVNRGIRDLCDGFAAQGYRAIAFDLFWRQQRGVELDPDVPEQFAQALKLMGKVDFDATIRDIEATLRFARGEGAARAGVIGWCMGGGLAYLAATRTDCDASVGYYGAPIPDYLSEAHAIARPLLLHFANADHFIPAEKLQEVHAVLDPNPRVTIHDYPGVDHGFATRFGQRRDEAAAQLADGRTADFLAEHLQ